MTGIFQNLQKVLLLPMEKCLQLAVELLNKILIHVCLRLQM